jgi:hypothetical protein
MGSLLLTCQSARSPSADLVSIETRSYPAPDGKPEPNDRGKDAGGHRDGILARNITVYSDENLADI